MFLFYRSLFEFVPSLSKGMTFNLFKILYLTSPTLIYLTIGYKSLTFLVVTILQV